MHEVVVWHKSKEGVQVKRQVRMTSIEQKYLMVTEVTITAGEGSD